MFALQLNRMTERAEYLKIVAISEDRQKLVDWMVSQLADAPYVDETNGYRWHKVFKKYGPLEWFNKPNPDLTTFMGYEAIIEIPSREEHIEQMKELAAKEYDALTTTVPLI